MFAGFASWLWIKTPGPAPLMESGARTTRSLRSLHEGRFPALRAMNPNARQIPHSNSGFRAFGIWRTASEPSVTHRATAFEFTDERRGATSPCPDRLAPGWAPMVAPTVSPFSGDLFVWPTPLL